MLLSVPWVKLQVNELDEGQYAMKSCPEGCSRGTGNSTRVTSSGSIPFGFRARKTTSTSVPSLFTYEKAAAFMFLHVSSSKQWIFSACLIESKLMTGWQTFRCCCAAHEQGTPGCRGFYHLLLGLYITLLRTGVKTETCLFCPHQADD